MLLKTGQCFTEELALNCPTIVACVAALPNGSTAVPGDLVLGKDGQYHAFPADADAQQLSIAGNVISLTNGGSVTLPAQVAGPAFATPAEARAGTSTTTIVNPADLYARESIAAQTGVSNDVTAIPAPTAGQSPWATNLLGETLHYAPGLGWKIVDDRYGYAQADVLPEGDTVYTATMPRAGLIDVSGYMQTVGIAAGLNADTFVFINPGNTVDSIVAIDRTVVDQSGSTADANHANSVAANRVPVTAGQVVTFFFRNTSPGADSARYRFAYQYTK